MTSFIVSSAISIFISTALSIWTVISMWIIFKKAWRKWWESIIPVWNIYVLFKIIWKTKRFWILLCGLPLIWIIWMVYSLAFYVIWQQWGEWLMTIRKMINRLLWLASFIFMIISLILTIIARCRLAKKFGKSGGFAVLLIFLTPIFTGILAFSDAKCEWIEFNEKYSWKKYLLITIWISLIIACCYAGLEYKQYKDFYDFYYANYDYGYEYN